MECDTDNSSRPLSNSAIQNVLSNPQFQQQLLMSQATCPSSEIQGIKIGDRVLPVRVYEKDGKSIMQIVIPESPENDMKLEHQIQPDQLSESSEIHISTMTSGDVINQFSPPIDSVIDNLDLNNPTVQDLPITDEDNASFVQGSDGYEMLAHASTEFATLPQNYFAPQNIEATFPAEIGKIEPEMFDDLQQSTIAPPTNSFTDIQNVNIDTTQNVDTTLENSKFIQASANVIQAVKNQFKVESPKRRKIFQTKEGAVEGTKKLQSKEMYTCNFKKCRRKFSNKIGLDIHLYSHTGLKPITCKVCEKSFLNTKLFNKHKCKFSRPHMEKNESRYECETCHKSFGNVGTLFVHKRSHTGKKPYACGLCSKTFTLKPSMYRHVKTHGADVRYKCQTCDEMFKSPWHLEEHLMSHMNEKKIYNCTQCVKVFTSHSNYIKHVQTHSINVVNDENSKTKTVSNPDTDGLMCNICLKSFSNVVRFQQHLLIHGPKRFQCTECNKKFVTKEYLQNHLQWYIAKFALGEPMTGHNNLIKNYRETNQLNVDQFLCLIETKDASENTTSSELDETMMEEPTKTFLCEMCGNYFFSEKTLVRHIKFHNLILYKCSHCEKRFTFRANLIKHEQTHENLKEYPCNVCPKSFSLKSELEEHMTIHNKSYACNLCEKKFSRLSNLRRHKKIHQDRKELQCPECSKTFICPRYLKDHVFNVHTSMGRKKKECPICHITLSGSSSLNRHINQHTGTPKQAKKLECEICQKRYEFNCDLELHMRSHSGEKPFVCDECGKGFISLSNLRRHTQTHVPTKDHVCETCGKSFKIERYLIDHMKIHNNPAKIMCQVCNASFSTNTNMKRHMLVHTGQKPFSCPLCQKCFRTKGDVDRHQLVHTRGKKEECKLCGKKFKHRELLRRHLEKHERGIPTCDVCLKQFTTNYKLHRHQQIHQDNFICNVCNSTFKTSLQLQKHVETHDITEMRNLILNMGSIVKEENKSPSKPVVKSLPSPKPPQTAKQTKKTIIVQPLQTATTTTNYQFIAPNISTGDTPIITISQLPISGAITNVISIKDLNTIDSVS